MEQRELITEQMYNTRKELVNLLSYVHFAKLFNVLKYFPELNQHFVKEGITFPVSSSSRAIKCQSKYINEL